MANIQKEVEQEGQKLPTHEEIQKRAHKLYLARGGDQGRELDDWLVAEEQLRRERDERLGVRITTFVAGRGGVARTNSPSNGDFVVAEEERRYVQAAEELKEERQGSSVPRTKAVAVDQQRNK